MAYKSPNENVDRLLKHLEENGKDRSWMELSAMFYPGRSEHWSRKAAKAAGIRFKVTQVDLPPIQEKVVSVTDRVTASKNKVDIEFTKKENEVLTAKVIELQKELDLLGQIKSHTPEAFTIPKPVIKKKKNNAVSIIQWSDWHVDEVVEAETVNGLNEYNKDIAKQRAHKLFENGIKLIDTQRYSVDIRKAVIHLGGDSIGGYIHPELEQTNSMSPLEGIFYAKDLMTAGIKYSLDNGGLDEIVVVCSRGNHPRLTKKMQYANDYSMNLETNLYLSLADHFAGEKRVKFKVEQSELSYLTVYDRVLRFFHGQQIKFMGGIGGVTVPLYKAIFRWNQNIQAYYNFMCDKHTWSTPTPDCQINGSLKGYDAFAASHGFGYQDPIQSFTLLDDKYGITIKAPIFCK